MYFLPLHVINKSGPFFNDILCISREVDARVCLCCKLLAGMSVHEQKHNMNQERLHQKKKYKNTQAENPSKMPNGIRCGTPHLFLFTLSNKHHNAALSLAAGAAHPLNESYRTLVSIEADDEVDVSDVETFLADTR